jgi:tRNA threonylcarbamoyladenosine biosynthesis protein TsaE
MTSQAGPAGNPGRLFRFRYLWMTLAYSLGHAAGALSTALSVAAVIWVIAPSRMETVAILLSVVAPASLVPAMAVWGLFGLSARFKSKAERRQAEIGITVRYLLCVGIMCGAVAGFGFSVLVVVPSFWGVAFVAEAVLFGSPLLGLWWVMRRKARSFEPDYDDEMRSDPLRLMPPHSIDLPDLAATESFGRRLGGLLFPNAVVGLTGPLGAGKTQLSRAIAEGLGIANPAAVTSPTFTLIHEYPARLPIYHFDAYRLNGPNEFLDLGVTEYFEAGGVCLIEWADKVESALPAERLTIRIEVIDENRRRVEIDAQGDAYQKLKAEKWWAEK